MTRTSARLAASAASLAGILALTGSAATADGVLPDVPIIGSTTTTAQATTTTLAPVPAHRVYFTRDTAASPDLWSVDPATISAADPDGDAAPVAGANSSEWDYSADVSPDGRTLAFVSDRDGDHDVYLLDLVTPGASPVQLTKNTTSDRSPAWSPDGSAIAYVGWAPTAKRTNHTRVHVTEVADGATRTVIDPEPRQHDTPAWSPDGAQLVFSAGYTNDADLFVADATSGKVLRQLTDGPTKEVHRSPDWSPDGSRIVFTRMEVAGSIRDLDLLAVPADGGTPSPVVAGPDGEAEQASWHPDGRSILFSGVSRADRQLHRVAANADGTWGAPVRILASDGYDTQPKWASVAR